MDTPVKLLTDILAVLDQISNKLDSQSEAGKRKTTPTTINLGSTGIINSLLGKKGAAAQMAEDVEKLKKAMSGNFIKNLNNSVDKLAEYNKLSEKHSKLKTASGWAHAAMDMGKALMYIAGGVLSFTLSIKIASSQLNTNAAGVFGFILASMAVLGLSMIIITAEDTIGEKISGEIMGGNLSLKNIFKEKIKSNKNRNKSAIQNAKDMGIALMLIAGGILSFAISLSLSAVTLGVGILAVPLVVLGVISILGLSMIVLSALSSVGDRVAKGLAPTGKKTAASTKNAIQNAKDMGIALMFIAGGILSFAITLKVVPILLKEQNLVNSLLVIGAVILGLVSLIFIMAIANKFINIGIKTAIGIGVSVMILAGSILVVALVSKALLEMFRTSKVDEKGKKQKSGPFSAFGEAIASIGIFGLFTAGLAVMLWALGLPVVSGPILLGSMTLITMAIGLILTAKAIKKVNDTMKEMGGAEGMKRIAENIRLMVGGVISGIIAGVMGKDEATKLSDADITLKDVKQFRRATKIIKMLGTISSSLTKFAEGLKAFSKVGEIASLEYEEKDGVLKPKLSGEKIHVSVIAKTITDTFGVFIKNLVESTESLTKRQAKALKTLGKALTGDRGIISAVSQFSTLLKTFAEFGAKSEVYVPAVVDENGKVLKAAENVPISKVVENIVTGFKTFIEQISGKSSVFKEGGALSDKIVGLTEVLIGTEGGFLRRKKPGILTGISTFNDMLLTYSEYGADGTIPKKDKDGNIIKGPGIKITDIVSRIISGLSLFVTSLSKALTSPGMDIEKTSKDVKAKISSLTDIIESFNKLAEANEGMDKLANSTGLLANNIGLLVNNTKGLDTGKLQTLADITAKHAVATKGVEISPSSQASSGASQQSSTPTDWNKIGDIIADKIAAKLTGFGAGEFKFTFYDNHTGVLEIKK